MLSIIIPMFNEEKTIFGLLESIFVTLDESQIAYEIVVVNDASRDNSRFEVEKLQRKELKLIDLATNSGKGHAVQVGIENSIGDIIVVQDADNEYSPGDLTKMFNAFDNALVPSAIYGSRTQGASIHLLGWRRFLRIWPRQGVLPWAFNRILSFYFFLFTGRYISDLLTGYKMYPRSLFDNWTPLTSGFETDHEISMRLISLGIAINEVPVFYSPRSKSEGKKIKTSDAFVAMQTIYKFRKN